MGTGLVYEFNRVDRVRFRCYEAARSVQPVLREASDGGARDSEVASRYGLVPDDVVMAVYASRVRRTARV